MDQVEVTALRDMVQGLPAMSGAKSLSDDTGVVARLVRVFEPLDVYHQQVLRAVAGEPPEGPSSWRSVSLELLVGSEGLESRTNSLEVR